jgi:tyrosinase
MESIKMLARMLRRSILMAVSSCICLGFTLAAEPKERKNIDDLTPQELAAYKHAIHLIRTSTDPANNYQYHANLHNLFLSSPPHGCEHGNDLFFPWHRWHLANFEKALQATDPMHATLSTKDVTIPYWNWTKQASGARFPKDFENELDGGLSNSLWNDDRNVAPSSPFFNEAYMTGIVRNNSDWALFAGRSKSVGGGFGALEISSHNTMHGSYIGGTMGDPTTAAMDPIYWSFHAFIDFQWDRWQRIFNKPPTSLASALQGFVNSPTVKETISVTDLGYFYTHTPESIAPVTPVPLLAERSFPLANPTADFENTVAVWGGRGPFVFRLASPGEFQRADIWLEDFLIPQSFSYQLNVFIHPANRTYQANDLAGAMTIWKGHTPLAGDQHHKHGTGFVTVTKKLKEVTAATPDQALAVTIETTPIPLSKRAKANAQTPLPDAKDEIQFKRVHLVLNGGVLKTSSKTNGGNHGH